MSSEEAKEVEEVSSCPTKEEVQGKKLAEEVHSANSWETANLGDEDRNNKFLKLMGASKKKHSGRFVIGDQNPTHKRPASETLVSDLADQYEQSMEHKLASGWRGHLGLGFHQDDQPRDEATTDDKAQSSESDRQEDDRREGHKQKDDKQNDDKQAITEYPPESSESSHPLYQSSLNPYRKRRSSGESALKIEKKKMTFVKSSS